MRTIVCSAGTSVAKGKRFEGEVAPYKARITEDVRALRLRHKDSSTRDSFRREVCAEVNSLRALGASEEDTIVLLHTDTPDGEACAQVLGNLIEEEFSASVQLRRISGLQVTDATRFRREGIKNLFAELDRLERESPEGMLLNGTGGFKSVVPYLTLFGLLRKVPVTYLFEYSEQLITLPAAPVTYDYERVSQALDALRQLEQRGGMTRDEFWRLLGAEFAEREYFECLLDDDGENVFPSAFGFLLLSAGTEPGRVFLSEDAKRAYEQSRAAVRDQYTFILERIAEPLNRQARVHVFHGTDLLVYKPGNTSERAAYFVRGRDVYVCAIAQHDTYERTFGTLQRAACEGLPFEQWTRPAAEPEPETTEAGELTKARNDVETWRELAAASESEATSTVARLEAQRATETRLTRELTTLRSELRGEREALSLAERERATHQQKNERLEAELRDLDAGRLSMGLRAARGLARNVVRSVQSLRRGNTR